MKQPFGSFAFNVKLNIGGEDVGSFQEVSGLGSQIEVQDYMEGGRNNSVVKLPGHASFSNISLKKGFCTGFLAQLYFDYCYGSGKRQRINGEITLLGDDMQPAVVWRFVRGIPLKWDGPQLSVNANTLAVEALEIAHEGLSVQVLKAPDHP